MLGKNKVRATYSYIAGKLTLLAMTDTNKVSTNHNKDYRCVYTRPYFTLILAANGMIKLNQIAI